MATIRSILVTGTNRGLGLEFVKQFLTNSSVKVETIIAAYHPAEDTTALLELQKSSGKVKILPLEVSQYDTYDKFAGEVAKIVGEKGLTLLINNAGIGTSWFGSLDDVTPERFITLFKINSIAPVLLTKALRPLLKISAQNHATKTGGLGITRAAVINISSAAGSIQLNTNAVLWCYRESKAALNMSTRSLGIELEKDGILVSCIHPGHVNTTIDVGSIAPAAKVTATTSVAGMISVLLQLRERNTKGFYAWNGSILPF